MNAFIRLLSGLAPTGCVKSVCKPVVNYTYVDSRHQFHKYKYSSRALVLVLANGTLSLVPLYLRRSDGLAVRWTTPMAGEPIAVEVPIANVEEAEDILSEWAAEIILQQNGF